MNKDFFENLVKCLLGCAYIALGIFMSLKYVTSPSPDIVFGGEVSFVLGIFLILEIRKLGRLESSGSNWYWILGAAIYYPGWLLWIIGLTQIDLKSLLVGVLFAVLGFCLALYGQVLIERQNEKERVRQ